MSSQQSSVVVKVCQVCESPDLESLLFLGFLPPVNQMQKVGERPVEQPSYPAQLLRCPRCHLVQLGLIVDPKVLFPPDYPYTSGTTRILRENFADLYRECTGLIGLKPNDLIIDIGSNDGTLLSNFKNGGYRVQGIEPADVGNLANQRDIPTLISFFNPEAARKVRSERGRAKIVTATNVFAHMRNIHEIVDTLMDLLDEDNKGVFVSESHYLHSLIATLQYDTIYHEHLRYYSLRSLKNLLEKHGLTIFHAKRIPTHGGSLRVYAARKATYALQKSVGKILREEDSLDRDSTHLRDFRRRVVLSKLQLYTVLFNIKQQGKRIYGIGAPSRASTLINYIGIDDGVLDCVLEVQGSQKIGKYIPGTLIPVLEETRLFDDQPDYALLLSWHIADELMPKLSKRGFKGDFIIPLPTPQVIAS